MSSYPDSTGVDPYEELRKRLLASQQDSGQDQGQSLGMPPGMNIGAMASDPSIAAKMPGPQDLQAPSQNLALGQNNASNPSIPSIGQPPQPQQQMPENPSLGAPPQADSNVIDFKRGQLNGSSSNADSAGLPMHSMPTSLPAPPKPADPSQYDYGTQARQQVPESEEHPGFWNRVGRFALGTIQHGVGQGLEDAVYGPHQDRLAHIKRREDELQNAANTAHAANQDANASYGQQVRAYDEANVKQPASQAKIENNKTLTGIKGRAEDNQETRTGIAQQNADTKQDQVAGVNTRGALDSAMKVAKVTGKPVDIDNPDVRADIESRIGAKITAINPVANSKSHEVLRTINASDGRVWTLRKDGNVEELPPELKVDTAASKASAQQSAKTGPQDKALLDQAPTTAGAGKVYTKEFKDFAGSIGIDPEKATAKDFRAYANISGNKPATEDYKKSGQYNVDVAKNRSGQGGSQKKRTDISLTRPHRTDPGADQARKSYAQLQQTVPGLQKQIADEQDPKLKQALQAKLQKVQTVLANHKEFQQ